MKVSLPIPLTANDVVERIADAAGPRTRLAIIDHISSPTAIVFPVAEITRALKAKGVRVMIDGAHAVGQLALDLPAIGADWYTANAHKWLYAPKGSRVALRGGRGRAAHVPLSVSHWHDLGFPRAFDYVGTRDVTPFLERACGARFHRRVRRRGGARYLHRAFARRAPRSMRELGRRRRSRRMRCSPRCAPTSCRSGARPSRTTRATLMNDAVGRAPHPGRLVGVSGKTVADGCRRRSMSSARITSALVDVLRARGLAGRA